MKKERIDVLLVERGYFSSREKARRAVMAGVVFINEQRVDKPGTKVSPTETIDVRGEALKYVGRGGLKMERAIEVFHLDLTDRTVLDVGASTGGFTDCCLQNGAKLVYAVDVGYNQLAWKLRQDHRVIVMERTNFRYVRPDDFHHGLPDFACVDVSFISLRLILPVLKKVLVSESQAVCLIKPQFEAGREEVGKKGVVRRLETHVAVVENVSRFAADCGFSVEGLTHSPVRGGDGNIEFLLALRLPQNGTGALHISEKTIQEAVYQAHQQLNNG